MRKIYNDPAQTNALFNQDDNRATKQDIVDLSNQIEAVDDKVDNVAAELEGFEQDLQDSVNTNAITAETAGIDTITSDKVTTAEVEATTIKGSSGNISSIQSNEVNATNVIAGQVIATDLNATKGTIGEITSSKIETTNAKISNANITNANIENANIENYSTENVSASGNLSVTGDSTLKDVTADSIDADSITSDEATIDEITTLEEKVENIVWNGKQTLNDLEDFFISVPHFENGIYYFQLIDNSVPIATVEIHNSVDNYFVRWSQLNPATLLKIYKVGVGTGSNLVIECNNETGNQLELKYATTSVTPNVAAPTESIAAPEEYENEYAITYKDGNKFYKNVDFANQGGTVGILDITETDDWSDTTNEIIYDTTENINAKSYKPDQSVNTDDEVEFAKVSTTFIDVKEFTTPNFMASSLHLPNTVDLTEFDDGALITLRNSSTASEPQPSTAYIKRTISGNVALLPVAALNGVNSQTNVPLIWDATTHSLKEANNLAVPGDLSVTGDLSVGGGLSISGDVTLGKVTVTDEATFQDKVDIEDDLTVAGDLYVKGTTHTTGVEDITATSDTITLRANNNTALGTGQVSGIVVNKYDGTNDLALVTDNDGTMRVGTGTGTDTTYNKVALKAADGKYYTYDDTDPDDIQYTLMNPQPSGTMTAWTNKHIVTGYTLYATATFTVIDKTSLIPLLGRAEETDLSDKQILQWDANGAKAIGITPAENGMFLKASVNPGVDYHWSAITFSATGYASMLYAFPERDDTVFMDLALKQGTKPTPVPSQATTVSHTYNDFLYYTETDKIVSYDSDADKYYEVFFNTDGTCTVDTTPTIIGDPTALVTCTIYSEKIDNVHGTSYQWAVAGGKGVEFIGTRAQYEVAKLIPFGQEGYIPSGALVIITDEDDYIEGEDR